MTALATAEDVAYRASVSSPQITTVVLEVRGDHDAAFRPLEATGGGGEFVVALPAWADSEELELYAEGRNARGQLVTRSGSPLRPLHLSVTGPVAASEPAAGPGGSIVDEWWFWTLAAVVVVGAAVGIGVGVTLSNDARAPAGTLPPGRVVLP